MSRCGTSSIFPKWALHLLGRRPPIRRMAHRRTRAPGAAVAPVVKPPERPREGGEDIERRLIALLGPVPVSVDELARASEATAREVRTVLLGLKLAGRIEWHGGDLVSSLPGSWPGPDCHEE